MPKVGTVTACRAESIHYDSTSTGDEIVAAFVAKGWVAGQLKGDYKTVRFRRAAEKFEYSAFDLLGKKNAVVTTSFSTSARGQTTGALAAPSTTVCRVVSFAIAVVQKTLEVRAADVDVSSRTFTSGTAQAMALIVAVSPPRVLCATKVTAFNDDKATIQVTASGEQWSNSTSQDLSTNLDKAVLEGAAALIKNAK